MAQHSLSDRVAIISMGCTRFAEHFDKSADGLAVDAVTEALDGAGLDLGRRRRLLARHLRLRDQRHGAGPAAAAGRQAGHPRGEHVRDGLGGAARGGTRRRLRRGDVAMAVGVEKLKDTGYAGLISPKTQDDGTRVNTSAPANFSLLAPAYKSATASRRTRSARR